MSNLDKYIGIPYKNLGRDFKGIDCYGLLWLFYKNELNIILPDYKTIEYENNWYQTNNHLMDNITDCWEEINELKKYCGLIFWMSDKRIINHCGLYIGDNKFLHIYENTTSMISSINEKSWKARLVGKFNIKEDYLC